MRVASHGPTYGWRHAQVRARVARFVASGKATCARCGKPLSPLEPWDLGHDDNDPTKYWGPECRGCNRATTGRFKVRAASRKW